MNLTFLLEYVNVLVLGICLCIGYVIKTSLDFINNKYIPVIMLIIGVFVNILINIPEINASVMLSGMFSGLSSTGLYEALRNMINTKEGTDVS